MKPINLYMSKTSPHPRNSHKLTDHEVRRCGYYWVRLPGCKGQIGMYCSYKFPDNGKFFGFWLLLGQSATFDDGDFDFIDSVKLEPPKYML